MQKKLQINQVITLHNKSYKIIGIDTYSLKNIYDQLVDWVSYTLIDSEENKTWVSGPINGFFYQWSLLSSSEFKKLAKGKLLNDNLTGMANITFEGNPGFSTPCAEIVWIDVNHQKFDCVVVERFIAIKGDQTEIQEAYFNAGTLLKDIK